MRSLPGPDYTPSPSHSQFTGVKITQLAPREHIQITRVFVSVVWDLSMERFPPKMSQWAAVMRFLSLCRPNENSCWKRLTWIWNQDGKCKSSPVQRGAFKVSAPDKCLLTSVKVHPPALWLWCGRLSPVHQPRLPCCNSQLWYHWARSSSSVNPSDSCQGGLLSAVSHLHLHPLPLPPPHRLRQHFPLSVAICRWVATFFMSCTSRHVAPVNIPSFALVWIRTWPDRYVLGHYLGNIPQQIWTFWTAERTLGQQILPSPDEFGEYHTALLYRGLVLIGGHSFLPVPTLI